MQKCEDINCPKHGKLSIRGAVIEGKVVSDKPKNTVIVQREYLHKIPKYERYERRRTKINAHAPPCMEIKAGDKVRIGECRKISKTKTFVVIEKITDKKK